MWMMPLHLHVNQKSNYDDDGEPLDKKTLYMARRKLDTGIKFYCLLSQSILLIEGSEI